MVSTLRLREGRTIHWGDHVVAMARQRANGTAHTSQHTSVMHPHSVTFETDLS